MALTKRRPIAVDRYLPARELAARATSKHGNPADHAVVCSLDVAWPAQSVATHVYAAAIMLDEQSRRSDAVFDQAIDAPQISVAVEVPADGESIVDRGGFSLAFMPRGASDGCPRFEGRVRIDHVDAVRCRVVAQGRYTGLPAAFSSGLRERSVADAVLREIVALLTAGLPTV